MNIFTKFIDNYRSNNRFKHSIWLIGLILFIIVIAGFALQWNKNQRIKAIGVSGNNALQNQEIYSALDSNMKDSINKNIRLNDIRKGIDSIPFVDNSYPMHKNTKELTIEIDERQPSGIVILENGDPIYLDRTGKLIPYRLIQFQRTLPLLRNIFKNNKLDTIALKNAITILNTLNKEEFTFIEKFVSEIIWDESSKSFNIIMDSGEKVILGNTANIYNYIDKLSCFIKNRYISKTNDIIDYIDLRWNDKIIVKTKQNINTINNIN